MSYHAVYLIHEDEYRKSGTHIYKLGRTTQEGYKRLNQYPKGATLKFHAQCSDSEACEKGLLGIFNKEFKLRRGKEYFEGDADLMVDIIYRYVREHYRPPTIVPRDEDDEPRPILINTYEQFRKIVPFSIILTSKKYLTGFVRYPNSLSLEIVDPTDRKDYDEGEHETLRGLIEHVSETRTYVARHKLDL